MFRSTVKRLVNLLKQIIFKCYTLRMRDFLHHLFIPRSSNNHRSKLLHHDALLLVVALLFAGFIFLQGMHREYPAVLGDAASVSIDDLLKYTNLQRQINNLPPLKLNNNLNHAAQMKAKDMFAKDYWAHVSPDGTTPWVFIKDSGYNYMYAGENLALVSYPRAKFSPAYI